MQYSIVSVLSIGVQVVGFAIIIFKGGAFIGSVTTQLEQIRKNQDQDVASQLAHERDDVVRFRDLNTMVSDVRVEVAKLTPKEN